MLDTPDPREHTLRLLQRLVTRFLEHQIERDELVGEVIAELEAAGYGPFGAAPGQEI
jgi:hypothetical protein